MNDQKGDDYVVTMAGRNRARVKESQHGDEDGPDFEHVLLWTTWDAVYSARLGNDRALDIVTRKKTSCVYRHSMAQQRRGIQHR